MATMGRTGGHQRGDLAAADGEVFMATVTRLQTHLSLVGGQDRGGETPGGAACRLTISATDLI